MLSNLGTLYLFTGNSFLGFTTVQLSNPNKHLCWLNACTSALLWAKRMAENFDYQLPLPTPEDGIEAAILRYCTVSPRFRHVE